MTLDGRPAAALDYPQGELGIAVGSAYWRAAGAGQWELVLATEMENRTTTVRRHERGLYGDVVVARRAFAATCFDVPAARSTAPDQVTDAHIGFLVSCAPKGSIDLGLLAPAADAPTALHLTATTTPSDCVTTSS